MYFFSRPLPPVGGGLCFLCHELHYKPLKYSHYGDKSIKQRVHAEDYE